MSIRRYWPALVGVGLVIFMKMKSHGSKSEGNRTKPDRAIPGPGFPKPSRWVWV